MENIQWGLRWNHNLADYACNKLADCVWQIAGWRKTCHYTDTFVGISRHCNANRNIVISRLFHYNKFCPAVITTWGTQGNCKVTWYRGTEERHTSRYLNKFYIHGSVHRESNLIIVQQDVTYSVYYISVSRSTRFGCWHTSSGVRTNVNTASGKSDVWLTVHRNSVWIRKTN